MRRGMTSKDLARDLRRAWKEGEAGVKRRQEERLADLVRHARAHSAFYRAKYAGLPEEVRDVGALPVVTKAELMERFDDWVTVPELRAKELEAFVADKGRAGELYLGTYAVWNTSGTTGKPAVFVHDEDEMALYETLTVERGWKRWLSPVGLLRLLAGGRRSAAVVAVGGHFAGAGMLEYGRRHTPGGERLIRVFPVTLPRPELVAGLNAFRPAVLLGYTTALKALAAEQEAGRLRVNPAYVIPSAEHLDDATRADFERTWRCSVRDIYSASEFMGMAMGCEEAWMHVNTDWCILESVDEAHRPAAPGQPGHTTLLTSLANRAQPLLRYDLGDRVTMRPDPCPCGSPLPAIRVEGRTHELLYFNGDDGPVAVIPKVLASAVEDVPGLGAYQFVQTAPRSVRVRFEVEPGRDADAAWRDVEGRLAAFLRSQGLENIRVVRAAEPPQRDARSGKFLLAWVEANEGPVAR